MKILLHAAMLVMLPAFAASVSAKQIEIGMNLVNEQGTGNSIGTVTASDTPQGLMLVPRLKNLTPGLHGFHVHEKADCAPAVKEGKREAGGAAGGHYDPASTGKHEGPAGEGHLGDLPALMVNADGTATLPIVAPRLKLSDIKGRSLMVHAGQDNYSDAPAPLGGGGGRVACGLIK